MLEVNKNKVAAALFIIPLAFDYKNQSAGGNFFQYSLVFLVTVAFLYCFFINYRRDNGVVFDGLVLSMVGTVVVSLVPFFLWDIPVGNYLRVGLSYLLFCMGYIISLILVRNGYFDHIFELIAVGCAVSVVVSFINGCYLSGDIYTARYQILSPVVLCSAVVFLHKILIKREIGIVNIACLLGTFIVVVLSQTRSCLGAFLFITAIYFIFSGVNLLKI